ncbi:NAD(+)/NADH kinase [Myxococcota bacterium]|nr:NAD(+)/NADH kinase [Myxococcota bacterium]
MPGIGIISNANARINKKYPSINRLINTILGRRGELIQTFSLDELDVASKDFLKYKLDFIIILGGDGTIHKTLDALVNVTDDPSEIPPILPLPAGTMNIIPTSLGLRGHPLYNLVSSLIMYRHNIPLRAIRRNLLRVNDNYGFLFGIGGPVTILNLNYSLGKSRTKSSMLLVRYFSSAFVGGELIQTLFEPLHFRCSINGEPTRELDMHTIFCSFAENLPFRWTLFPRAGWYKDRFEALFFDYNIPQGLWGLFNMWRGTLNEYKGFHRHLPSSLVMDFDKKVPYQLDGDLYPPTSSFKLTPGPELQLIVPPSLAVYNRHVRDRMEKLGPWQKLLFT